MTASSVPRLRPFAGFFLRAFAHPPLVLTPKYADPPNAQVHTVSHPPTRDKVLNAAEHRRIVEARCL